MPSGPGKELGPLADVHAELGQINLNRPPGSLDWVACLGPESSSGMWFSGGQCFVAGSMELGAI